MEKLLFTGGTGFLGRNIKPILDENYEVTTIGIMDADMIKANFVSDIPELPGRYDIVLHAAGKHIYIQRQKLRKKRFMTLISLEQSTYVKPWKKWAYPKLLYSYRQ